MSKKILYISYYFEPDLGAGAFRNTALAKELSHQLGDLGQIELFTCFPNRYPNIEYSSLEYENYNNNLQITRIKVAQHDNSFLGQMKSFWQFKSKIIKLVKDQIYDLVFVSSSKLFSAHLAYQIAKKNNIPLYIDLRDLFAKNLKELFPRFFIGHILSFAIKNIFEKPAIKYAIHLNLNSAGFKNEFNYRSYRKISFFPNGIDDYFIGHKQNTNLSSELIILTYAGNIGEGQGLEKIIPLLAMKLGDKYQFNIIGSGSSVHKLSALIAQEKIENINLIPPVKRHELIEYYKNSHYLFLHLNNFKSFEKVIPSKVFEYGAFNIPILAGVAGFPAEFIKNEIKDNYFIFKPCDVDSIYQYLINNHYFLKDRIEFVQKYKRDNINSQMAKSILSYL